MTNKKNRKIKAVIFDWAGTTVDFGSMAPLQTFAKIFSRHGLQLSVAELRAPMGLPKIDHIRELLKMERVSELFRELQGRLPEESDVSDFYREFEPELLRALPACSAPLEGAAEVVAALREDGIKIGSTTGYTREMIEVVASLAAQGGFAPDCLVASDEVSCGRPAPYMIFKNMEQLGAYPPSSVLKVGDTKADIAEGRNAGVVTAGVIKGSSILGLSREEYDALPATLLADEKHRALDSFIEADADFVLDELSELPDLVRRLNNDEK